MTQLSLCPAPDPLSNPWGQCPEQAALQAGAAAGSARTQLSPAGKAASASPVCEHKHLLGACSETPAQAVQLPASVLKHNKS